MNCWKSFNVTKDLGSLKLTIFSLLGMIGFFIVFNLLFDAYKVHSHLELINAITFITWLVLIFPIHKVLHGLPIWLSGRKAELSLQWSNPLMPSLHCNTKGPISKPLAIISLTCPAVLITTLMISLAVIFPAQMNEYGLIGAINFSLSVFDIFYLVHLLPAPSHSFIEDDRDGCRILIKESAEKKAIQ